MNKAKIIAFMLGLRGKKIDVAKAHKLIDSFNVDGDKDIDVEDLIKKIIDGAMSKIFDK